MKFSCCFFAALIATGIGFFQTPAKSDILLPKIFCDHMVLQRNSTIPVSGTANPDQKLTITFQQQEIAVTANDQGEWSAELVTADAGGPYEITIVANDEDAKIVINDVLVGDVWLCSGQSNMSWPVSKALNAEVEIEQSKKFLNLRLFEVAESVAAKPEQEFLKIEPWHVCSPESVKDFSATGYFFGRELVSRLGDVPIGLVSAAVGGTPCEAWIDRQKMDGIEPLKPLLEHWDQNEEINSPHRPANLFNGMISPLSKFPITGVIWYQGEANVGRASQYRHLFPALIQNWRQTFGQPDLPFCFAQLAPFNYQTLGPEALPAFWEVQRQTMIAVPNTEMAVLTDVGNLEDIHPTNKQQVGQRLALLALDSHYADEVEGPGAGVDFTSPFFESASITDNRIQIKFSGCESGLKVAGESATVSGFMICGEDKTFVPANAEIMDDTVVVSAAEVENPVAVRYGWNLEIPMNLTNGTGLPASPFRTDNFPVSSADADF